MTKASDAGRTASIYTLSDPRNGEVRYVGVTAGTLETRLKGHLRYKGKDHRTAWVRSLLAAGVKPVITEIAVVPFATRGDTEQEWIARYRASGARLTNSTHGGLGSPGYKHTAETRARLSAKGKGRPSSKRGIPVSEEQREKMRQNALLQMQDPAAREAVSRVHKGKTITPEQRAAVGAASTKRWAEWRANGQRMSEESLERMRQAARLRPGPPPASAETRAKQAEVRRKWWAAKRAASGQLELPLE